jgi:hypothetical protein
MASRRAATATEDRPLSRVRAAGHRRTARHGKPAAWAAIRQAAPGLRAFLAADPSRRLSELMRWLKDERPIRGQNEPVRAAAEVSTLALRRFCGFG